MSYFFHAISCSVFLLTVLHSLPAETPRQVAHQVAVAAGIQDFYAIDRIEFTFNAKIGEDRIARSWTWWPQQDQVRFTPGNGKPVDYLRVMISENSTKELREIDQKFVNDTYWLIFPFKVVWDDSVSLEHIPEDAFTIDGPVHGGLKISYPEGVGYTPGDVYEIYYDTHYLIKEWVFRKGGSETPSKITAWENYNLIGPLVLSLDRPATDGSDFRIWFTEVSVKWVP